MYSFKQVFKQQPSTIVAVLSHFLTLGVAVGWIGWSALTIAAVSSLSLSLLTLFYIKPLTVSTDALGQLNAPQPVPRFQPGGIISTE